MADVRYSEEYRGSDTAVLSIEKLMMKGRSL